MFERYTDDARKVIFLARYEASRLGSPVLQVEHLWLGLLRQNKRLIKRLAPHIKLELLESRLLRHGPTAERISLAVDIPLSDACKRALTAATATADASGQRYITSETLILSLLLEEPLLQ